MLLILVLLASTAWAVRPIEDAGDSDTGASLHVHPSGHLQAPWKNSRQGLNTPAGTHFKKVEDNYSNNRHNVQDSEVDTAHITQHLSPSDPIALESSGHSPLSLVARVNREAGSGASVPANESAVKRQRGNISNSTEAVVGGKDWIQRTRSTGFVMWVIIVCVCCMVVKYGHKEGQANSSGLLDLMKAYDLCHIPSFWQDPIGRQDFSRVRLRKSMPRVALAALIWLLGLYGNNVCQAWLQIRMANFYDSQWVPVSPNKKHVLLWDIGHEILPAFANPSVRLFFSQGAPVFVVLRFCVFPGPLTMRWTILSRMFLLWGVLWAIRTVFIIATVLPNPDGTCKPSITYPNNIFMEALAIMPFDAKHHEVTCQDVSLSGHTVLLTLATLMWLHYVHWAPWPEWSNSTSSGMLAFRILLMLNVLAGYYCIIASKFHYTADVLIGCLMSIFIFQAYHSWLLSAFLHTTKASVLHRFFTWFEEDAVDLLIVKTMLQRSLATQND